MREVLDITESNAFKQGIGMLNSNQSRLARDPALVLTCRGRIRRSLHVKQVQDRSDDANARSI